MKFKVRTRFVYDGHFVVDADSKEEAEEIVGKHCGMVGSDIHSTVDADWHFDTHPEKIILSVREIKSKKQKQ